MSYTLPGGKEAPPRLGSARRWTVKECESQKMLRGTSFSRPWNEWRDNERLQGGVGGASKTKKSMGTTTVDMIANTRSLEVARHVNIFTTPND